MRGDVDDFFVGAVSRIFHHVPLHFCLDDVPLPLELFVQSVPAPLRLQPVGERTAVLDREPPPGLGGEFSDLFGRGDFKHMTHGDRLPSWLMVSQEKTSPPPPIMCSLNHYNMD